MCRFAVVIALCDDVDVDFSLELASEVLTRTPSTLNELLRGLSDEWLFADKGPLTWSPFQVLGHLAHIEESDWMDRTVKILAEGPPPLLEPVDREAGFARFAGWTTVEVLDHFDATRTANLTLLDSLVTPADLERFGIHPTFGEVTLHQLLAAWAVHDLNHLDQIVKTMAKQYREAIGPWREFLPIVEAP